MIGRTGEHFNSKLCGLSSCLTLHGGIGRHIFRSQNASLLERVRLFTHESTAVTLVILLAKWVDSLEVFEYVTGKFGTCLQQLFSQLTVARQIVTELCALLIEDTYGELFSVRSALRP